MSLEIEDLHDAALRDKQIGGLKEPLLGGCNLERGRRKRGLLHLKRLAKALGVRPSGFFEAIS